jgi:transposase
VCRTTAGAWRRGHRSGTILVDLAPHRVVDLLPARSAVAGAVWLARHPAITGVSRDRSALYADGIRQGAPPAVQAAAVRTAPALTAASARVPRLASRA